VKGGSGLTNRSIDQQFKSAGAMGCLGTSFVDTQFMKLYDTYSFEYRTAQRPAQPQNVPGILARYMPPPQPSACPLLTVEGLVAWFLQGILLQPHRQFVAVSHVLSSVQLFHHQDRTPLPRTVPRSAFPEAEDAGASAVNRARQESIITQNNLEARLLDMAARQSDISAARMRGDIVVYHTSDGTAHADDPIRYI